jgi:hypothetical protein
VLDGLLKLQDVVQRTPGWNVPHHKEMSDLILPIIEKPVA